LTLFLRQGTKLEANRTICGEDMAKTIVDMAAIRHFEFLKF